MFTLNTASSSQINADDEIRRTYKFQPSLHHRNIEEDSKMIKKNDFSKLPQDSTQNLLQKWWYNCAYSNPSYLWFGVYGLLISFCIPCSLWTIFTLGFLIYIIASSNFGKRCWVTAPRDLRFVFIIFG